MVTSSEHIVRGTNIERRRAFWVAYIRLGFVLLAGESLAVLGYLRLTPHGPHRGILDAIVAVSSLIALGSVALAKPIAARPWRARFSLTLSLVSGVDLAICAHLDGGVSSPLLYLAALPVIGAALVLPSGSVLIAGAAAALEFAVVALAGPAQSGGDFVLLGSFLLGVIFFTAITARYRDRLEAHDEAMVARLEELADRDPLTGCLNHRVFDERLVAEIDRSRRYGQPVSLLVADIDLFKSYNDAHGHAGGDAALRRVAALLLGSVRNTDTVARIGGDEFAVILPSTPLHNRGGAHEAAQRVLRAVDAASDLGVSLSVGVATLDATEPTAQRLFRDADRALYRAKFGGRHRVATSTGDARFPEGPRNGLVGTADTGEADRRRLEERVRQADRVASERLSLLDVLASKTPVGLGFVDRQFRILRINPMLADIHGGAPDEQIGCRLPEVIPDIWPQLEPSYRRVLETAEPVTIEEVCGETAADPGRQHVWLSNLYPIWVEGEVTGIGVVVLDITDQKKLEESQRTLTHAVVAALGATVERRDPYTAGHLERVAAIAQAIAADLGCDAELVDNVGLAARIHDLGKVAIPAELLVRPGALSDVESALVHEHVRIGAEILETVDFPAPVREMIVQHHERLDGSGYPAGLAGEQICLGARIIAVADTLEAMAADRPYRASLGPEVALKELVRGTGRSFDPAVVESCVRLVRSGQVVVGRGGGRAPESHAPADGDGAGGDGGVRGRRHLPGQPPTRPAPRCRRRSARRPACRRCRCRR